MTNESHRFIAHFRDDWYPVCRSRELGSHPVSVTLFSTPIALFGNAKSGTPAALLDRCPHRNVPLSLGKVKGERLQCAYHGWEFDAKGECCAIPGLVGEVRSKERGVASFATKESQGFIWIYGRENATPTTEPYIFPHTTERGYTSASDVLDVNASLHAVAENALDVPHTAFLHGGLFRNDTRARREIEVIVRRSSDRVEAEYVGESRPPGIVAKFLAPRGGEVIHFDRFILPCVAQVEYRLGDSHLCISAALSPVEDYVTRLFVMFTFRLPIPGAIVKPFLRPFAMRVFKQDAAMLARQTQTIETFGEERYKFTEIDVLGAEIFDLLRNGRSQTGKSERRLRLGV